MLNANLQAPSPTPFSKVTKSSTVPNAIRKISRLSANRYRIEVTQLVRGRIPPHGMVEFTAADQEWLGNHDHGTVLITDGRYDPRLGDFCRKMILNQANFPTGANKRD